MIEIIVIVVSLATLLFIFFHRWSLSGRLNKSGKMSLKKNAVFNTQLEKGDLEVTAEEIMSQKNITDPKLALKADNFFKKAEREVLANNWTEAEKLLIQAISMNPGHVAAHSKLGVIYLNQEFYGKAELMFRKLVMSVPDNAVYHSNLGMALFQQNRIAEAKDYYQKAVELDDKRAGRFFSLARVYHALGEFDEAVKNIHRALDLDETNIDYGLTLASWYMEKDLIVEAKKLLSVIHQHWPEHELAKEMLAEIEKDRNTERPIS